MMSVSILLLSLVFALIEAGLTWLLLAFQPVTALTAGLPVWLMTGTVFALGMLLSFIVIIVVGALEIGPRAASFVRDHFGRTLVLGLLSVVLAFGLAVGGEALYQMEPVVFEPAPAEQPAQTTADPTDVCFVLDYSISMNGNPDANMKQAFAQVIAGLPDGQRVSIVRYDSHAVLLQDWIELNAGNRAAVVGVVQGQTPSGGTEFENALQMAGDQAEKAVLAGRKCSAIMLSDGEDTILSVAQNAPKLIQYQIPVYTMYTGSHATADVSTLQKIAAETGGEMKFAAQDLVNLESALTDITHQAAGVDSRPIQAAESDHIPDTLLTERDFGRAGLFDLKIMRMAVLFLVGFVFKLICVICVGNNNRFIGHFLHAFFVSALAAAAVEFGYALGFPVIAAALAFWVLMMGQIVLTK